LDYYQDKGLLRNVDGDRDPKLVGSDIAASLDKA
jgi:hypothetical protein